MKTIIDISDYASLGSLEMTQYEVNAYVNVLEHLLEKKVSVEDEHYQYYEKKYIQNYIILNREKDKFMEYLSSSKGLDPSTDFNWFINFDTKEVTIND